MHNCCYSQNINFNKNFTFQVRKIKLHTIIGEGLTGELLSTLQLTGLSFDGRRASYLMNRPNRSLFNIFKSMQAKLKEMIQTLAAADSMGDLNASKDGGFNGS